MEAKKLKYSFFLLAAKKKPIILLFGQYSLVWLPLLLQAQPL